MRRTTGNGCAPSIKSVKKPKKPKIPKKPKKPRKKGRKRPRFDNEPLQLSFQQGDWDGMARFHAQMRVSSFFDLLREMEDHPNANLIGKTYTYSKDLNNSTRHVM